ncbi:MAG: SprT family zinc-dependent metalloprotease [Pseudomonadota bacterium]|nr:SprT family zinc-dependent metalloprotease [Pseudomonadota bacterium]
MSLLNFKFLDTAVLNHGLDPFKWHPVVNKQARNLSLRVEFNGSVKLIIPPHAELSEIKSFVRENLDWIAKSRAYYASRIKNHDLLPREIFLRATNSVVKVIYSQCSKDRTPYWGQDEDNLYLRAPIINQDLCWPLLKDWLKLTARNTLRKQLNDLAKKVNLTPKKLQIRLQKSRWGSCSSLATISLNAALMLRPLDEVDYVIIHELCHLKHMNHSSKFWKMVSVYSPQYKRFDHSLNEAWKDMPYWLL